MTTNIRIHIKGPRTARKMVEEYYLDWTHRRMKKVLDTEFHILGGRDQLAIHLPDCQRDMVAPMTQFIEENPSVKADLIAINDIESRGSITEIAKPAGKSLQVIEHEDFEAALYHLQQEPLAHASGGRMRVTYRDPNRTAVVVPAAGSWKDAVKIAADRNLATWEVRCFGVWKVVQEALTAQAWNEMSREDKAHFLTATGSTVLEECDIIDRLLADPDGETLAQVIRERSGRVNPDMLDELETRLAETVMLEHEPALSGSGRRHNPSP